MGVGVIGSIGISVCVCVLGNIGAGVCVLGRIEPPELYNTCRRSPLEPFYPRRARPGPGPHEWVCVAKSTSLSLARRARNLFSLSPLSLSEGALNASAG